MLLFLTFFYLTSAQFTDILCSLERCGEFNPNVRALLSNRTAGTVSCKIASVFRNGDELSDVYELSTVFTFSYNNDTNSFLTVDANGNTVFEEFCDNDCRKDFLVRRDAHGHYVRREICHKDNICNAHLYSAYSPLKSLDSLLEERNKLARLAKYYAQAPRSHWRKRKFSTFTAEEERFTVVFSDKDDDKIIFLGTQTCTKL